MFQTKILSLADAKMDGDGSGRLSGYASVFGGVDSYGDTIVPGAYKATIPKFLKDGFIPWGHNYDSFPVATPDKAREDDHGLWIEAVFHTDAESQRARQVVSERLDRGKSMGLSIGYIPKSFDFTEIDGHQVRRLTEIDLLEVSIVPVPADDAARVSAVKSAELKRRLNREQMDRIIAVLLEALAADEAETGDDPTTADAGKSADPIALLQARLAALKTATDDDVLAARDGLAALLADLGSVRGDVEALVKRADLIGSENPRELFRQFRRLESIYGAPIQSGRVAV